MRLAFRPSACASKSILHTSRNIANFMPTLSYSKSLINCFLNRFYALKEAIVKVSVLDPRKRIVLDFQKSVEIPESTFVCEGRASVRAKKSIFDFFKHKRWNDFPTTLLYARGRHSRPRHTSEPCMLNCFPIINVAGKA